MKPFSRYERLAEKAHGHLCAGQILGIRMAIYGLSLLGLDDPTGAHRKRLVTIVEIDRCATDAIGVVTGCRLGKRALKFHDYGKMAATFCDLESGRAVRLYALDTSKQRAAALYPGLDKREAQMRAYRELSDADLFSLRWVRVNFGPEDLPGFKGPRAHCAACGEEINFRREVPDAQGRTFCRACSGASYYQPL